MPTDREKRQPFKFAIVGIGGIFDRHLAAIEHIGGELLCACDTDLSKKTKLDSGVQFFSDFNEMRQSMVYKEQVDWVVICTPNYHHPTHIKWALQDGKNVLCEKPVAINRAGLEDLENIETDNFFFNVLQLRTSKKLMELRSILADTPGVRKVKLELNMHRDASYWHGWKGSEMMSGGILFNIGVHYFDLLLWLFGKPMDWQLLQMDRKQARGVIRFTKADVQWSIDLTVPVNNQLRVLTIDGESLNLTRILESAHNEVYENLIKTKGTTLNEITPTIQFINAMTYG